MTFDIPETKNFENIVGKGEKAEFWEMQNLLYGLLSIGTRLKFRHVVQGE